MTKSTTIVFILIFSILFKLEKKVSKFTHHYYCHTVNVMILCLLNMGKSNVLVVAIMWNCTYDNNWVDTFHI